jgi:hypothetical protein
MSVFVAEIDGRGIAAVNAGDLHEAESFFDEEWFKSDLQCLDGDDKKPLWNGKAEIYVREAFSEEFAKWQAAHSIAVAKGEIDGIDDPWLVYLVAVTDSTDEDADED